MLPSARLQEENLSVTPRLFECSNKTGTFLATEIIDFTQDDLEEDDVYLLDAWDQVSWGAWGLRAPFISQADVPKGMEDLQQPDVVGWKAGTPMSLAPYCLFCRPPASGRAEDGLPVPFPMDRWVEHSPRGPVPPQWWM